MRPPFPFETSAPAPPAALLRRFDRCASHDPALPPLAEFSPSFGPLELREALWRRGQAEGAARRLPLHLAVRVPCEGCLDAGRSAAALAAESAALAAAIGPTQHVSRVTLQGCGDATAAGRQLGDLLDRLAARFRMDAAEVVVEARWPGASALRAWRAAGATSLVLEAVRASELGVARDLGFGSVTVRVACGRRGQDGDMLADELRALLQAGATRVHLRAYASTLESACDRCLASAGPIALFEDRGVLRARAIATLQDHGLRHVARGLFAPADDALALARERDRLHLEVDGLSASPAAGTLAIGAGSFGRIGAACYRNAGGAREHVEAVESHGLSVVAGVSLSTIGQARRSAVASLVCHARLDFEAIALAHLVEPRHCFARELQALAPLVRAGLVEMDVSGVELTTQGEHLVDSVIAAFDPSR